MICLHLIQFLTSLAAASTGPASLEKLYPNFFETSPAVQIYYVDTLEYRLSSSGVRLCSEKSCKASNKSAARSLSVKNLRHEAAEICKPWGIKKISKVETECSEIVVGKQYDSFLFSESEDLKRDLLGKRIFGCDSEVAVKCRN